jgi:hypothetical protein
MKKLCRCPYAACCWGLNEFVMQVLVVLLLLGLFP